MQLNSVRAGSEQLKRVLRVGLKVGTDRRAVRRDRRAHRSRPTTNLSSLRRTKRQRERAIEQRLACELQTAHGLAVEKDLHRRIGREFASHFHVARQRQHGERRVASAGPVGAPPVERQPVRSRIDERMLRIEFQQRQQRQCG